MIYLSACQKEEVIEEHTFMMGTMVSISVAESLSTVAVRKAIKDSIQEMQRIEMLFSTHTENSIQTFNQAQQGEWVQLDLEVSEVLVRSVRVMQQSQGAFNPMLGKLKQLWAFDTDVMNVPAEEEIQSVTLSLTKGQLIQKGQYWQRSNGALQLDFGAIAKGYAIDRAIDILRKHGIRNAIVNAGGDLRLIGQRFDRAWRIGIKHPRESSQILGWMALKGDVSLVTSGDYERFFVKGGKRYHHILNAKTGYPANVSQSVTVIAKNATLADAWSTALFVLGEKALQNITLPDEIAYLLVDQRGKKHMSPSMKRLFHSQ